VIDHRGGTREKAKDHWAYRLLRKRPNAYQTPIVFKQTETAKALLWGNSRSYIHRAGMQSELIPLRPDATITAMVDGEKWHLTKPDLDDRFGGTMGQLIEIMKANQQGLVVLADKDVLHIPGFGDGVNGYSLFTVARQSLEISLGADSRSARQMTKGFAGKVVLEAPEDSPMFRDQKKAEEFLADWKKRHSSDGDAEEVALLRGGVKANVLQMSNRDAEFLGIQQFQRQEAALWLCLESILGDDTSVSYNSEEQKQLAYLKNCLAPWLKRWEEECEYKLLSPDEFYSDNYYIKFNVAALLRTDTQTTIDTLSKGIASRIYNPNEARAKLDENPYEGGDDYFNPAITPGTNATNEPPQALVDRLDGLLKIEQKRVGKFLERGDTYEQIEQWYDTWCETLGNAIENLGGDRITAQQHCVGNLEFLKRNPAVFDLTGTAELLAKEVHSRV